MFTKTPASDCCNKYLNFLKHTSRDKHEFENELKDNLWRIGLYTHTRTHAHTHTHL